MPTLSGTPTPILTIIPTNANLILTLMLMPTPTLTPTRMLVLPTLTLTPTLIQTPIPTLKLMLILI